VWIDRLRTQLGRNVASGAGAALVSLAVTLAAYPIYLRFLGYAQLGLWLVLSTVLTFAQLGSLGLDTAVMSLTARELAGGRDGRAAGYIGSALCLVMLSGTVVVAVVVIASPLIVSAFSLTGADAQSVTGLLPYIGLLTAYLFVGRVTEAVVAAQGRMDLVNAWRVASRLVVLGVSTVLLAAGAGLAGMAGGAASGLVVVHVASLAIARRGIPLRTLVVPRFDRSAAVELTSFGGGLVGGAALNMLLSPFNRVMLARYASIDVIPLYDMAYGGCMQLRAVAAAAFRALVPEISALSAERGRGSVDAVRSLTARFERTFAVIAAPVWILGGLLAEPLLRLWLGSSYVETLPAVVRIMLVASFLSLVGIPGYYCLVGLGRSRSVLISHALQAAVSAGFVAVAATMVRPLPVSQVGWAVVAGGLTSSAYLVLRWRRAARSVPESAASSERVGR